MLVHVGANGWEGEGLSANRASGQWAVWDEKHGTRERASNQETGLNTPPPAESKLLMCVSCLCWWEGG